MTDFTSSKFAKSPYGDKTFDFESYEVTIEHAIEFIRNEFVLNRNYEIPGTKRLRRMKKDLEEYLIKDLEFVIVDIDKVYTKSAQQAILQFFIDNDYHVGIIPSRSWNGVDNFNLKVILKTSGWNTKASVKGVLEEINETLFPFCKIDLTAMNEGAYQAPAFSEGTLLLQEGSYVPDFRIKEEVKEHIELDITDEHGEVIDICITEYQTRGFRVSSVVEENGIIIFNHPSEKTKNGYFLFINNPFYMNHYNKSKGFSVFNAVKGKKVVQNYFEEIKSKEREDEFLGTGSFQYVRNINSRFIKMGDSETKLINRWLDDEGLFKIKSAMGTGKSTVIDHTIKECEKRNLRVLLVTNRISVAKDFKAKYDIKLYSEANYEVGDDLIVQFDSLRHYSLQHFDVVILDEFVSIMLHSRNGMSEFSNLNRVKLMYAMRNKTTMIADAFLFGIEDQLIPTKPKYGIINSYREDLELFEYNEVATIVDKIRELSLTERGQRRKVTVSCTSLATAKAVELILENEGLKTMLLSADTLEVEKDLIYKEFEKDGHNGWNVLLYTPTLTVGVSILNKSDHHFHIDESMSADVISSIQMIRRSRKAKTIHYFVKNRKRFLETSADNLNWEVRNNIEKYYKNNHSLLIDVNEHGDFVLSKVGEFINNVEVLYNKLENNHKHSFELLMSHQVSSTPTIVPTKRTDININQIKKEIKNREQNKMKEVLCGLDEVDYDEINLDEFSRRNYLVTDKEKMIKLMSEIRKNLKDSVSGETLKEITEIEIGSGFKYLSKLKKLKFYLTKNETDVNDLLGYLVGEELVDKGQIQYFRYIQTLKKNGIRLKDRITNIEIQKVNDKIGWGDFRALLIKIGYVKRSNVHRLEEQTLRLTKSVK